MKTILKSVCLLLLAAKGFTAFAQGDFKEGCIVYDVSYPGASFDAQTLAMLPDETTWFMKDGKVRIEQKMGMGMSSTTIVDSKTNAGFILMDMMGNKTVMKFDAADKNPTAPAEKPKITLSPDTKKIAGYVCKKAEVTDSKGNKNTIYYTDEIKTRVNKGYSEGIDGFPLEMSIKANGFTFQLTAKKLVAEKVDDALFTIPAGYEEKSMDDMKKMMPGR